MKPMMLKLMFAMVLTTSLSSHASTVAYWRYETGPADTIVQTEGHGYFFTPDIPDVSGNGNHLSAWTSSSTSGIRMYYRGNVISPISQTEQINNFSVQNGGNYPALFTKSSDSTPSGIDAAAITPAQFTVEAFFNPQESTAVRTILCRAATGVCSTDPKYSSFALRLLADNSVEVYFVDVSGYLHTLSSATGVVQGFDQSTDPTGLTGTWYHVAVVSDGSTLKLYLTNLTDAMDTELIGSLDLTLSGSSNTALSTDDTIWSNWEGGNWHLFHHVWNTGHTERFFGLMDEVRISNTALEPHLFLCRSPISAWNPTPSDGDVNCGIIDETTVTVNLGWNTGPDPSNPEQFNPNILKHYVYLSNNQNETDDPNLYLIADISATGATGETIVTDLALGGWYFWRVDEALDKGGGVATLPDDPNTITGPVWSFKARLFNLPPEVDAGDTVYTWLTEGTVDVQMAPTIIDDGVVGPYTVLWEEAPDEDPNLVINSSTVETTTITIDKVGTYTLSLTVNDGELEASDTVTINVYENACAAAKGVPGYTPLDGDIDDDCDIDIADLSMLAVNWLDSTALSAPLP